MQQKASTVKQKEHKATGRNYRIFKLPTGKIQIQIRSSHYGSQTITRPVGTSIPDAHKIARNALHEMANRDTPELAKNVLKRFTLSQLIEKYLEIAIIPSRERSNIVKFVTDCSALCSNTLDKHGIINKGLDDYIDRRTKEHVIGYTSTGKIVFGTAYRVTRQLSPLRTMYRNAGSQKLYGLLDYRVTLRNAFEGIQFPKDISGRKHSLKPFDELKIFKAIDEYHTDASIENLKWITVVNMALITCLRRGVLLHLKWRDVEWDNKWIRVHKSYWMGEKKAPEYVPITHKLEDILKRYYDNLTATDRKSDCLLFVGVKTRRARVMDGVEEQSNWIDSAWSRIIRLTDLYEPMKTPEGETIYDAPKGGSVVKDWFHFHDLRATAESRYARKPYNLVPEDYGYLMGHLGRKTETQDKYDRYKQEQCNEIREAINKGDAIENRGLQKPEGDAQSPYDVAYGQYVYRMFYEFATKHKEQFLKHWSELLGAPVVEVHAHEPQPFPMERWLEEKAKADEWNKRREEYNRKYDFYPENDIVMQAWEASGRTTTVNKDRASAYLQYVTDRDYYEKHKIEYSDENPLPLIREWIRQTE